jgi:hypothetical protein
MRSHAWLCASVAVLFACGGGADSVAPPPTPAAVVESGGNQQTGVAGTALAQPLRVRVTSGSGAGIAGVTVAFTAAGSSGGVSVGAAVTDADGFASTIWTVGTTAGVDLDTVRARVNALEAAVFTATVTAASAASLSLVSGDAQTGRPGQSLSQPLVVIVRDQYGNPRSHVDVTWSVVSGGGTLSNDASTSGFDGRGSTIWTPGNDGPNAVRASAGTLVGSPVSFVAVIPEPVRHLAIHSGDAQSALPGSLLAEPLVVRVTDASGNPVPDIAIDWSVSGGGSVSASTVQTGSNGRASVSRTLGVTAGPQAAFASAQGVQGSPVVFGHLAQEGVPDRLVKVSGDNQVAPAGTELNEALVIQVLNAAGDPVPNRAVLWAINSGNGSITPTNTTTDAQGRASTRWTLGTAAGSNRVDVIVSGVGSATFSATARAISGSGFDIELRFLTSLTSVQRQAFSDAKARWEGIITGDLSSISLFVPAGFCGSGSPGIDEVVDDLLILVTVEDIDGQLGVLGSAGPCVIRASNGLPYVGQMRFDVADLEMIEELGALSDVILHEMGHVLGVGSIWDLHGLLADASLLGGTDPHFTGTQAISGFDAVGGSSYILGEKVPVENTGGPGRADGHWRESVFANELMTGLISLDPPVGTNPLSTVTIRSLADLGYTVDLSKADPYNLLLALRSTETGSTLSLGDDRLKVPIRVVDQLGRVVRVVPVR